MSINDNDNQPKEPWYVAMWRQHTTWFVVFTLVVCAVAWGVMSSANSSLRECHEKIMSAYQHRTHATDSLIASYRSLIADSTITPLTAIALNHALTRASETLAGHEAEQKTLHLLELEFAKIQNEYEVLNLWCALLTVVFLIFSFFSIFKTNEMTRQGEEALVKLGQTAAQARQKSDSIDTQVQKAEERVSKKTEELSKNAEIKFKKLSDNIDAKSETVTSNNTRIEEISSSLTALEGRAGAINQSLDQVLKDKENVFDQYVDKHLEEEKRRFFSELNEKADKTAADVDELKKQIADILRNATSNPSTGTETEAHEDEDDEDEHGDEPDDKPADQ